MSINVDDSDLVKLCEAQKHIPGRPSRQTLWRWVQRGLRGGTVKLETIKVGGLRYTSLSAIAKFVKHLSAEPGESLAEINHKAVAQSISLLDEAGI